MSRVLSLCLLIGAMSAAEASRPELLVFKGPGPGGAECEPCEAFNEDYMASLSFRVWLNAKFKIVPAYDSRKDSAEFAKWRVDRWPTFVVVDAEGRELARVVGYRGHNHLAAEIQRQRRQKPKPPEAREPQQPVEPQGQRLQQLEAANRKIEEERDGLRRLVQLLQRDLAEARTVPRATESEIRQLENKLKDATQKIQGLERKLIAKPSETSTPKVPAGAICEDGVCTLPPREDKPAGVWRTVVRHGVSMALDFGLTAAQSEVLVPVVAGGGPAAVASIGALMLYKAWRRRKASHARAGKKTVVVDAPSPPLSRQIETQIVNVESDSYQRAHEQARQHVARRYPGSQEVLEAELSLTRQFLSGQTR